ncbi:hypothetical protein Cob_v010603 [Colletotrichum orbiculare MAFF 240422]|uniref:Ubiquitin-like protease family profile domain-containing protein n=1 Tax=Colletotrichum orbiculare (strain 104-T / ATCC 96160 / CBS 514.97 / LARS 414 / MAFF 240422) TaxID=1213857 RepID=N4VQG9_COLOR|nr:hypothetical protein Cob_v010603 [Colletotrichum orbiculare MAFF 240422]
MEDGPGNSRDTRGSEDCPGCLWAQDCPVAQLASLASFDPDTLLDDGAVFRSLQCIVAHKGLPIEVVDPSVLQLYSQPRTGVGPRRQEALDDLRKRKFIMMPVCLKRHWVLFVYSRRKQRLYYFDSLKKPGFKRMATNRVNRFLDCVYGHNAQRAAESAKWMKSSLQGEKPDCGLHVLLNAEKLLLLATRAAAGQEQILPEEPIDMRRYFRRRFENLGLDVSPEDLH